MKVQRRFSSSDPDCRPSLELTLGSPGVFGPPLSPPLPPCCFPFAPFPPFPSAIDAQPLSCWHAIIAWIAIRNFRFALKTFSLDWVVRIVCVEPMAARE